MKKKWVTPKMKRLAIEKTASGAPSTKETGQGHRNGS